MYGNTDLASHTLTQFAPRTTFIEKIEMKSKDHSKAMVTEEIGCCDRLMRYLSNDARSSPLNNIPAQPFSIRPF